MNKTAILCVDDEADNVDALERLLRKKYQVFKATSGVQALDLLQNPGTPNIAVILTDQRMPEMNGVEFLEKSMQIAPHAVRILATGYADMKAVVDAINKGHIYNYIAKPWEPFDLENLIDKAAERFHLAEDLRRTNRQLQVALEDLKTLDAAKTQFMLLINHELKTPLTAILSFSELLKESSLSDEQIIFQKRIHQNAERLKKLIEDTLLIMKGQLGQLNVHRESFESKSLLQMNHDLLRKAQVKNLRWNVEDPGRSLKADLVLSTQILHRLVDNAIKNATENSELHIHLDFPENGFRVHVRNQGPCIDSGTLRKIQSPFYIDEEAMHHSAGTGLGLSVCKALISAMGGQLQIENLSDGVQASFQI
jgi:two-component system sensor histidine kinase/response regulator